MGKLPRPDFSWIIDVGWEKRATFEYVNTVLIPTLADTGVTLHVLRTTDYKDNALMDGENCKLPAFERKPDGFISKFNTHCSSGWKRQVACKWLKDNGVEFCDTWIGISTDEVRRCRKSTLFWNQNRYPLIELGIDRARCLWLIGKLGWPAPPRTACYFCPNQSDFAWVALKHQYPDDFERAAEAERSIQMVRPNIYMHKSCVPLAQVRFSNEDRYVGECSGSDDACWSG
jgi:hypothetical protein